MREQLADYLDIKESDILNFKQRGDTVFVINGRFQKLSVPVLALSIPAEAEKIPAEADDLTAIDGIGAATTKKLNERAGIFTFAQLVAADSEETAVSCTLPLSKLRQWQVVAATLS